MSTTTNSKNYLDDILANIEECHTRINAEDHTGMVQARIAIERICKSIYHLEKITMRKNESGYTNLYLMINSLIDSKKFEEIILYGMHIIRVYGNATSHAQDFQLSEQDQRIVFFYLLKITFRYCEKYGLTKYPLYIKSKEYFDELNTIQNHYSLDGDKQYLSNIETLENNEYNLTSVLDKKTILIATGSHIIAEMLDRPIAEFLKNEIYKTYSFKAILIGDNQFLADKEMHSLSVISIGGCNMNYLTNEIDKHGKSWNDKGIYKYAEREINGTIQMALWADSSTYTRKCVEKFIKEEDGLKQFLSRLS